METTKKLRANGSSDRPNVSVQNLRRASKNCDTKTEEVPSIRLSPEQIEEIHADEYSLTLFYATRVEPLTLSDIKRQFPEPEPKKAQSVLDRYLKVGLIHIDADGRYYSNFPENYINYSDYRYDCDLEAKKDGKVFTIMKAFTGNKQYWKDKSYFSMDAFYTEEQTAEIQEMFRQIKLKSKEFANANAQRRSVKGLIFRRLKFYDMILSALAFIFLLAGSPESAFAGGNDPTIVMRAAIYQDWIESEYYSTLSGGGNDPTLWTAVEVDGGRSSKTTSWTAGSILQNANFEAGNEDRWFDGGGGHDPTCNGIDVPFGGGGHDPSKSENGIAPSSCCIITRTGVRMNIRSSRLCRAQELLLELVQCTETLNEDCSSIELELLEVLSTPQLDR
jgi:hypothetical protein